MQSSRPHGAFNMGQMGSEPDRRVGAGRGGTAIAKAQAGQTGFWRHEIKSDSLHWSQSLWRIHGIDAGAGALSPDQAEAFIHPDDVDSYRGLRDRAAAAGAPYEAEFRIRRGDGGEALVAVAAQPEIDENGDLTAYLGQTREIDKRRNGEFFPEWGEKQFRDLASNIPGGLIYVDKSWRYRFVNSVYANWFALEPEDFVGRAVDDVLGAEVSDDVRQHIQAALDGETVTYEAVRQTPAGGAMDIQVTGVPNVTSEGTVEGIFVLVMDVSAFKAQQRALEKSQRNLAQAQWLSQIGHWRMMLEDGRIEWSDELYRIYGVDPDTFTPTARNIAASAHPDDRARLDEVRSLLLSGTKSHQYENRVIRPDGKIRVIRCEGQPEFDAAGNPISIFGIARDVTEEKQAEEKLRRSEARFRALAEVASDWYWEMGPDLRFTYFSERVEEVVGVPVAFHIGKSRQELAGENATTRKWRKHFQDLEAHRPFRDFRYDRKGPDGKIQYLSSSGKPVFDEAGEFQGYIGIGSDLTNQVEAEDRANLANQRLAAAVEALSEPFVLWDSEDRLAIGNRRFREVNAPIGDKVMPGTLFRDFARALVDHGLVPEAIGHEDEWLERRLEHHRDPGAPFELERQGGTWLMIHDQRLPDGSTATISADITDIKIAEARLAESQERFREFAEVAADWFWEQDADLKFTNVTADNMAVTGMKQEDHYGKTRRETGLLDVSEAELAAHERQLLNREAFTDFRFSRVRPDGEKVYISISGKPFFDARDNFMGYRGAGRDITKQRKAEMALREGEERYRILTERSLQGIGIIQDGCVAFANNAIAGLLGYKPEEIVGGPVMDLVMAQYHDMMNDRREARLRDEARPTHYDIQLQHRDGSAIWVEQLVQTILWNGRPAVQVAIVDLSQRKKAEKALLAAKEEAEIANRAKSEFLAHFSHELRTPLNAIIGFSEIMLHELFGPLGHERYADYAGDIHHSGGHLLALISDILDLSRIEAGQFERDESIFDAGRTIAECVRLVTGRAGQKGVTFDLRLPDAGPWIRADQRQIRQMFLNLLSNAVKFTRANSTVIVEGALGADGDVAFSISDCGEGIAATDIKRVQEPFTRLGGAMTSSEEGTGLGLAITKRLAESHGGSLWLSSELGEGTTATIRLPGDRVIAKAS